MIGHLKGKKAKNATILVMYFSSIKRQLVVFFAIFAMAFASIAPSIAQAIGIHGGKTISMEVCSASLQKVDQVTIDVPVNDHATQASEHCPFCLAHAAFVLPENSQISFSAPVLTQFYPELFYRSPRPLQAWIKQPSQAPPVVSI